MVVWCCVFPCRNAEYLTKGQAFTISSVILKCVLSLMMRILMVHKHDCARVEVNSGEQIVEHFRERSADFYISSNSGILIHLIFVVF